MDRPPEVREFFSEASEDWTLEVVSPDLASLIGYTPANMIDTDAWEYVQTPAPSRRPYFTGQLASGEPMAGDADLIHRDGGLIPYTFVLQRVARDGRHVFVQSGHPLPARVVEGFDRADVLVTRMETVMAAALDNRFLSVPASMEFTSMSEDTLRKWADDGVIHRYGLPNALRYRTRELERAMALAWE